MQDNSPDGINLWLVNLRLKVIFVTVHSFIFSHSSVRESVHDTALCLSASWWGLMRCDLRDWQNKNLLGRFKRTFPSELCVSPGRLKIVQIFLLLSSFSAHPRFWWLKRGKKFEEIVINLQKFRRIVTPGGNQEQAMKNGSHLGKNPEGCPLFPISIQDKYITLLWRFISV